MKNKHKVFNLIILDESGSMSSIKDFIISGFNELVQSVKRAQTQFTDQEHYISLVSFNGMGIKSLFELAPVDELKPINSELYQPNDSTPLYDAMGNSIEKLKTQLPKKKPHNVLVTILTDGAENSSKEYDRQAIKKLVEALKATGWTFTYIGTDHNVELSARNISINNFLVFKKNREGISQMFETESCARMQYMKSGLKSLEDDFYQPKAVKKPKVQTKT